MDKIYSILKELRPEYDFHDSNNYIEDGLLESYDIIALIAELEYQFNITIDVNDIIPENFSNAESILAICMKSI